MKNSAKRVRFLALPQLLEMIENEDDFMLVEVLSRDQYEEGHLPGAVSLPVDDIDPAVSDVLPDQKKTVVTYCASYTCPASTNAARLLQEKGYRNVLDYKGSKKEWQQSGLELEKA